jgi:hypothetical protein
MKKVSSKCLKKLIVVHREIIQKRHTKPNLVALKLEEESFFEMSEKADCCPS